jgi:hypothetical protein
MPLEPNFAGKVQSEPRLMDPPPTKCIKDHVEGDPFPHVTIHANPVTHPPLIGTKISKLMSQHQS